MTLRILSSTAALCLALPTASPAQDASIWDGLYVGLASANNSGDMIYDDGGQYDLDGSMAGLMIGFNRSNGSWVYGGELAYASGDVEEVGNPGFLFTSFVDLKGRVGYAVGNALVYGTLGATFSKWDESSTHGLDGNGMLYGVGIDYLLGQSMFVGVEYVRRDITSDWNLSGDTLDADLDTLTLRLGMKF